MDKKRRRDLLLIGALLALAGTLCLLLGPGEKGAWAVVTVDGRETGRYPLWEDRSVTIGEADYNVLAISGGAAAVTEANCGDHTCVRTGKISREGETIVCLPHKVIVRIEGGEDRPFDADVG